jgi:hypothetical protein
MAEFQLGSISTGTLRPEDLIPAFTYTLGALAHNPISNLSQFKSKAMADTWQNAINIINSSNRRPIAYDHPEIHELIDELQDALQEYCPPFVYFGTHPGDGADFGFWPDMDRLEEEMRSTTSDFQADNCWTLADDGVIVNVSDHGNVTVMDMERNVIWSVV